jgi:Kelch motif.
MVVVRYKRYRLRRSLFTLATLSLLLLSSTQLFQQDKTRTFEQFSQLPQFIWYNVTEQNGPPPLAGQQMVYDPANNNIYMFGGQSIYSTLGYMWVLNVSTMIWQKIHTQGNQPGSRADESLVCVCYQNDSKSFILMFGGWYNSSLGVVGRYSDTWLFYTSNDTWVELNESVHPEPRSDSGAAFDPKDGIVLLYGGYNGTYFNDTWEFNTSTLTWKRLNLSGTFNPPPLADSRMAYDTAANLFLLFGGNNNLNSDEPYNHYNDLLAFFPGNNTWRSMNPTGSPSKRDYSAFVYDPNDNIFIMQGGYGDGIALGDTWLYNLNTNSWFLLEGAVILPARFASSFAYDDKDRVMLIYGGAYNDRAYSDTLVMRISFAANLSVNWIPSKPKAGQEIKFFVNISGDPVPAASYLWKFEGKDTSSLLSPTYSFSSQGVKIVEVQVLDKVGHVYNKTAELYIYPSTQSQSSLILLSTIILFIMLAIIFAIYIGRLTYKH